MVLRCISTAQHQRCSRARDPCRPTCSPHGARVTIPPSGRESQGGEKRVQGDTAHKMGIKKKKVIILKKKKRALFITTPPNR